MHGQVGKEGKLIYHSSLNGYFIYDNFYFIVLQNIKQKKKQLSDI